MIYDTLNNLPNYLGMSDNLDAVIEYIMARNISNLPAMRTGSDAWAVLPCFWRGSPTAPA